MLSKSFLAGGLLLALVGCSSDPHSNYQTATFSSLTAVARAPNAHQVVFATADDAVNALVTATRDNKSVQLLTILGPNANKLIYSGDKVADEDSRARFIAAYDESHDITDGKNGVKILEVGNDAWPMPIPLVHAGNGWWFDTASGQEEILDRRVGRNELNVLEVCRVYVEAQEEFATQHTQNNMPEYAQHFRSAPGQHNGLYWPVTDGADESPLGPFLAEASEEGYSGKVLSKHNAYHGYYYKILKAQTAHAEGGAKNYVAHGHMTGGFALIAYPARYNDSGVMTFIVNQNGIVYEKNLGAQTAKRVKKITKFDPDYSWTIVQ